MAVDFSNPNSIWASVLAETLVRLGLEMAVISPGSRSTPLTVALARHPAIEAIPVLDERSAAFFALGVARQTGKPVALVCTSGTAAANFFPAVIEARQSQVPLLVLTADRPPELRDCHAGQAIDQIKLYGAYPTWQAEVAVPDLSLDLLHYLRRTLTHAWERSRFPTPGPVHLNLPLRDPLPPLPDSAALAWAETFDPETFFAAVQPPVRPALAAIAPEACAAWQGCDRGLIVAGPAQPCAPRAYCEAIAQISRALGWPVLAEGLSPLRNYADLNPYLIASYDLLLRNPDFGTTMAPRMVLQIGELPTSKELRLWLERSQPQRWLVDPSDQNLDPLHGPSYSLRLSVEQLAQALADRSPALPTPYLDRWCQADSKIQQAIAHTMAATPDLVESKVSWLLGRSLPLGTPLFIANSMPVRDVEWFWPPGNTAIQPYFNRGANGIDGTLSTALGVAHGQSAVLLTGDLALLHDTNGFLLRQKFRGHLTIILLNNNGGGIFEMLPISQFEPPFEEFFATPQNISFAQLCVTYGAEYQAIASWEALQQALSTWPATGIRLLEIQTSRRRDRQWRQEHLKAIAHTLA